MFIKEAKRLIKLGVLEDANESEGGTHSFAQPKAKTFLVIFLIYIQNLNRKLKRKPYPMPKIQKYY